MMVDISASAIYDFGHPIFSTDINIPPKMMFRRYQTPGIPRFSTPRTCGLRRPSMCHGNALANVDGEANGGLPFFACPAIRQCISMAHAGSAQSNGFLGLRTEVFQGLNICGHHLRWYIDVVLKLDVQSRRSHFGR